MCRKMKQLHRPGCWLTSWLLLLLHILVLSSSSSSIAVSSSSVNEAILDAAAPPATSPNGGAGHEFGKRLQQHRPSPSQSVDIQQQHLIDAAMIMSTQATARLSDGDVVSCVPINMQPAVVNAKLLKVQLQPTITAVPRPGNSTRNRLGSRVASQLFALEFGACPAGTIPLRSYNSSNGGASSSSSSSHSRNTSSDPVQEHVRKPEFGNSGLQPAEPTASNNLFHAHAYTVTDITSPPSYKGTEVFINVWEPVVVEPHDFSLAQLWFLNTGLAYPSSSSSSLLNTIEAGWQVYPELYGDDQARLFIYWTGDAYNQTGCYNLNQGCPAGSPGFVQVSNKVLIGGSISPTSTTDSTQYEFKLLVFKDDSSGNWWLQFNNEYVGYWPDALFNSLKDMGDLIQWGGEILVSSTSSSSSNNISINMGSGDGSSLGYKKAAYQRNLQYVATDNTLHDVCNLQGMAEDPNCFSVTVRHSTQWGSYFYYGGSGFCNR
ncbi:unnamed protein product [Sphagnum jensenii]|uniref:Neprosin PEP catalytic domain-containing protein n=1 Tax=Sphagnum jensenii TaxID=128206 RepID=A0ABP1BN31_9BRYO